MSGHLITRRSALASAASLLAFHKLVRAQQEAPRAQQESKDTTFSADVNVVNVFATVRDQQGRLVRDLTKDDFSLDEDGRAQTIRYFSEESNLPLTLGLLVDTSLSQRRVLGEERTASYRFLDRVLREDKDHAFVIHFDREVELLEDLTSSRQKLEKALSQLELPEETRQRGQWGGRGGGGGGYGGGGGRHGAGTLLYDSILLASDELMKKQTGRKALILLTDGVDNGSKSFLSKAVESAQRADTLVYSILFEDREGNAGFGFGGGGMGRRGGGYPRRDERPDGKKVLERISRQTGGTFFEVSKKLPIDKVYDQIQDELRNQYSLGYTPDKSDSGPGYRHIHVTARNAGLEVQTRAGYYAGR